MIFLSCPYTHKDPAVVQERYETLCKVAAAILRKGNICISPNIYGHGIAQVDSNLPVDWEFWKNFCYGFLSKCSLMYVIQLEGWEQSTGVKEEIEMAKELKIPITYFTVEELLS